MASDTEESNPILEKAIAAIDAGASVQDVVTIVDGMGRMDALESLGIQTPDETLNAIVQGQEDWVLSTPPDSSKQEVYTPIQAGDPSSPVVAVNSPVPKPTADLPQAIKDAAASAQEVSANLIAELSANKTLSEGQSEAIVGGVMDAAAAEASIKTISDTNQMQLEQRNLEIDAAAGGHALRTELLQQQIERGDELDKLLQEYDKINDAKPTGIGWLDEVINEFATVDIVGEIRDKAQLLQHTRDRIANIGSSLNTAQQANLHTKRTVTSASIAENTKLIEARARVAAASARKDQITSNSEQTRAVLATTDDQLNRNVTLYNILGSEENKAITREEFRMRQTEHAQRVEKFKVDMIGSEIANMRARLAAAVEAGTVSETIRGIELNIEQREQQLIAITRENVEAVQTADSRLGLINTRAEAAQVALDEAKTALANSKEDRPEQRELLLNRVAAAEQDLERARTLFGYAKEDRDRDIARQEGAIAAQQASILSTDLNNVFALDTIEGRTQAAQAQAAAQVANLQSTQTFLDESVENITDFEQTLFGKSETPDAIRTGLQNRDEKYLLLAEASALRGPDGQIIIADNAYDAYGFLQRMSSMGTIRPEFVGYQHLKEINELYVAALSKKDNQAVDTPEEQKLLFNTIADEYMADNSQAKQADNAANKFNQSSLTDMYLYSPKLLEHPLYQKVISEAALTDADPAKITQLAVSGVASGKITDEEAIAGLLRFGLTDNSMNNIHEHGTISVGLPAVFGSSYKVAKPTGDPPFLGLSNLIGKTFAGGFASPIKIGNLAAEVLGFTSDFISVNFADETQVRNYYYKVKSTYTVGDTPVDSGNTQRDLTSATGGSF